jgi:predicted XRE-type DNA-binding protein
MACRRFAATWLRARIARVISAWRAAAMVVLHGFMKKSRRRLNRTLNWHENEKGYRTMSDDNPHFGSSFESFLEEEGIAAEVNTAAIKQVLAWQIEQAMKEQGISKSQMAKRMNTSRAYLDRFLDPANDKVQLDTMQRAAAALGLKLRLELV